MNTKNTLSSKNYPTAIAEPLDRGNTLPPFKGVSEGRGYRSQRVSGFTLVELIVVITILVILGTIGFTSISGFAGSARDSSRVSDLTNLSKSLEVSYITIGSYPSPDNFFTITYSGGSVWTQGTIGTGVTTQLNAGAFKMSKMPTDPLVTTKPYIYSKLSYGKAFQLKADFEGDTVAFSPLPSPLLEGEGIISMIYNTPRLLLREGAGGRGVIFDQAQAASGNPTLSYIKGNYNGVVAKTETGSTKVIYLLALPSILTSTGVAAWQSIDITSNSNNALSGTLFIHGGSNTTGVNYNPKVAYSSGALPSNDTERMLFASGIAQAYASNPTLASQSSIKVFIDAISNTGTLASLGGGLVSGSLGGSASSSSTYTPPAPTTVNGSCGTAHKTYSHTDTVYGSDTFCTTGTPLPTTPGFPTEWSPVNWTCVWGGSPLGTTDNCTAIKTATPINGSCGTANNTATVTAPVSQLCTTGNETTITTSAGTFTWDCTGVNLWTTANCSAPRQFTVTYNANGGTAVTSQTVIYNGTATTPTAPTRSLYTFSGWYSDAGLTASYSFASAVTGDRTLYAKWTITPGLAYSAALTYASGDSFTYTLPSTTIVTISVTGNGYGTVAGTKTLHTPACDTDDIAIWQNGTTNIQIWAACNVGASVAVPYASSATVVAGNTTPDATEKTRIGNLYQWGNKADITSAGTSGTQVSCTNVANAYNTSTFITGFSDWCSTASTDNRWWNTDNTSTARRWPCPSGYHIPSGGTNTISTEWGTAYVIANGMSTLGACNQTGTTPPYDRLRCAMMIPLSGYRGYSDGSFNNQGTVSYFWSSSPYSTGGYNANFNAGGGDVANDVSRAYGFSARCLKN